MEPSKPTKKAARPTTQVRSNRDVPRNISLDAQRSKTTNTEAAQQREAEREQKRIAAQERIAARQAKKDAQIIKLFEVPRIPSVTFLDPATRFGLAYIMQDDSRWSYDEGSLPYLFGVLSGMDRIFDRLADDDAFLYTVFFLLDESDKRVGIIDQVVVPHEFSVFFSDIKKHDTIHRDLSHISEDDELPPFGEP